MNFTLHERVYRDEFEHEKFTLCNFKDGKDFNSFCECGCKYSSVSISEIGVTKIEIQRNRYKEQRRRDIINAINIFSGNLIRSLVFPSFTNSFQIIESDAGFEHEEKLKKEEFEKQKKEAQAELYKYKNVGRNDICLCGSQLKYKRCCLNKNTLLAEGFDLR